MVFYDEGIFAAIRLDPTFSLTKLFSLAFLLNNPLFCYRELVDPFFFLPTVFVHSAIGSYIDP